jgi:hypothetical protein
MSSIARRDVVIGALAIFGATAIRALDTRNTPLPYSDSAEADTFVQNWAASKRAVIGALNLFRFADPIYVTTKEITWTPNPPQAGSYKPVTVPSGFVTDFASIPRVFWSALRPDGDYAYAAVVHDYLYWMQPLARKTADETLRFAMQDFSVAPATVAVIYDAVRIGGESAWNDNAKLKARGEKRVLKRLPDDPTVRWTVWKLKPDVFL